jgi:hypothetical protein
MIFAINEHALNINNWIFINRRETSSWKYSAARQSAAGLDLASAVQGFGLLVAQFQVRLFSS